MRIIKFRQLVNTIKPSGTNDKLTTKRGGKTWHYFGFIDGSWVSPIHFNQADQFTGLKDKNGIEIYESDIVKNYNGYLRRIDWIGAGFWLVDFKGKGKDQEPTMDNSKHLEIIGNINQNPELIN